MSEQETLPAELEITSQIDTMSVNLKTEVTKFVSIRDKIKDFSKRAKITPDVSTGAGETEARSIRKAGKDLLKEVKNTRLNIGRQCTSFNSGMIGLEGLVIAEIEGLYSDIDKAIKDKEQAAAERKRAKELEQEAADRLNQERIDKINAAILKLERVAVDAVQESMDSKQISERLEFCKTYDVQTGFDEFTAKANTVKIATVATLEVLLENKLKSEETERLQEIEDKRLKKQQEELQARIDKQKKEQEEEQRKIDAAQRQKQAELDEKLRIASEAQDKIDAENRKAAEELKRREDELAQKEQDEKDRIQKIKDDEEAEKLRIKTAKDLELKQLELKKADELKTEVYVCESITDLESHLDSVGFEFSDLVSAVVAGKIRHIQWID